MRHVSRTSFLVSLLALLLGLLTIIGAGTASASTSAWSYRATSISEFTMTSGQQWQSETQDRLGRTQFVFAEDGTFEMVQPDGFPTLQGTWSKDGTVTASRSTSFGSTGGNGSTLDGQVSFQNGSAEFSFTYTGGQVTAANVGGVSFGSSSSKVYHATVSMDQV